jgi:hypothetical protein
LLWFLFLFGALTVRGPLKWWLVGGVLLTMMLSMGKNLEWFNRIIFDYFPLYNKFRTPNSVLSITDFLMAILAILGLHRSYVAMQEAKGEELRMPLFIAAGVTGGLALLYWLVGPSLMDFSGPRDASYAAQFLGQNAQQAQVATLVTGFEETRAQLLRQDALRSLLFIALGFATLFVYLRKTISLPIMAGVLTLLIVVDFGGVTSRYYSTDNFSTKRKEDAFFEPSPADQQILADTDPNFRVFNQTVSDPFQDASTSYLHKSVGGYHAAKLQRYDDIISRHLRRGNQAVFDMLNTKYFIQQGQDGQPAAARNPGALGNAWLVNNIQVVNSADEEIDALSEGFNPGTTAVVHQEFSDRISGVAPTGEGMITLTSYLPSKLTYTFNSSAQQFAVFSEIWYGPDKGWTATIDGEEVDVLRANYLLRALVVPAGQHEIVFTFKPATYASGVIISYISSILLLAGLAFLGYRMYQSYESAPAAPQQPVPVKQPAAVPARKKPKKKK